MNSDSGPCILTLIPGSWCPTGAHKRLSDAREELSCVLAGLVRVNRHIVLVGGDADLESGVGGDQLVVDAGEGAEESFKSPSALEMERGQDSRIGKGVLETVAVLKEKERVDAGGIGGPQALGEVTEGLADSDNALGLIHLVDVLKSIMEVPRLMPVQSARYSEIFIELRLAGEKVWVRALASSTKQN